MKFPRTCLCSESNSNRNSFSKNENIGECIDFIDCTLVRQIICLNLQDCLYEKLRNFRGVKAMLLNLGYFAIKKVFLVSVSS